MIGPEFMIPRWHLHFVEVAGLRLAVIEQNLDDAMSICEHLTGIARHRMPLSMWAPETMQMVVG